MANKAELPQFLLDRFIKEIEYNPRLKNYLMQKQLARKGEKVKPGESFVAPVNFAPNKNYEAYKRRVDKYNREARAANDSTANVYLQRAAQREAYDNWDKFHEAERNAGMRKLFRDKAFADEKMRLLREEMVRRANVGRAEEGLELLNPNVVQDVDFAKVLPQNDGLRKEYYKLYYSPAYRGNFDGYVPRNPNKNVADWKLNSVTPRKPKDPGNMIPSNQEYIYRYHTTAAKNLPYIFNSGLDPMQGGKGFGKSLVNGYRGFHPSELQEVYTAVRGPEDSFAGYRPYENKATIRLKIPKKDYLKMDRNDTNPELDFDFRNESHVDEYGGPIGLLEDSNKELTTVQHGGRTDIFQESIPPKYIDEVYTEDGKWKDPWSFLEEYECDPRVDCEEWYDAISQYLDENGEWDWNKLRKMNKRMGR